MRVHRLKAISIALAGSALVSPVAYALDFAEARLIAEQQSPRISAQQLQVNVAESVQKAAGSLPDPKLSLGIENYPISGMDRWSMTRESMTMQRLALMQEVPNRAKRDAQVASAQARVDRERAALVLQRLQIRQELSLAWIAAQAVEQREILLTELLAENQRLQDSLPARVAGGTAQAGDLLVAEQEALTLTDRRDDLQRDRAKARAALRRWVGSRADEALQGDPGPLTRPVAQLRTELANHAELELYPAMQSMARAESREAQSETRGDWA
ncbi:TolC family protein [Pseudomonas putida]